MAKIIFCVKTQQEAEGLDRPPYPGALGKRIFEQVSAQAWRGGWNTKKCWLTNIGSIGRQPRAQISDGATERYFFGAGADVASGYVPPDAEKAARTKTAGNEQSGFALARRDRFLAVAESGHSLTLDGAIENSGKNSGLRPMEAVLIGAAACSAVDVAHILAKSRQVLTDFRVEVSAKRADSDPRSSRKSICVCRARRGRRKAARARGRTGRRQVLFRPVDARKTAKINHSCAIES